MKIVTSFDYPPIPVRNFDWSAIDTDTYDGAEDSSNRYQIGRGRTDDEAVEDLIGRLMDDEPAQITHRVRHFDEVAKALTDLLEECEGAHPTEVSYAARERARAVIDKVGIEP